MASARFTLSTRACFALPCVENDSSATRGSSPRMRRQVSADASAMSASCSASGSALTAQSANTSSRSAASITKKLDGVVMPGREADRHHPRLDHARRRVRGAGDHRIGIAGLDHQAGVEQRLRREPARDRGLHVGTRFDIQCGVRIEPRAARGVDEDRLGEPRVAQPLRSGDDALVARFGKGDAQTAASDALAAALDDARHSRAASGDSSARLSMPRAATTLRSRAYASWLRSTSSSRYA